MVLEQQVEQMQDELIRHIQECVRLRSVKDPASVGPGAPFGQGVQQTLDWFLATAAHMGFATRNIDGYVGVVEWGEGDVLGILGHLDVVPEGDGWSVPPYAAEIHDGRIFGRGVSDDKGPALAALYAMKALKDAGYPLTRKIRLILGTDEESGWADLAYYQEREQLCAEGFTPDGKFPLINAEKGILHVELRRETTDFPHIIAFNAGERPNIVPHCCTVQVRGVAASELQQAIASFSSPPGVLVTWESNGEMSQTLCVHGVSAHGSLPQEGVNAALYAVRLLRGLPLTEEEARLLAWIDEGPGSSVYGEGVGLGLSDEVSGRLSLNVGQMEIAAGWARLIIDIRYPVSLTEHAIVARMQTAAEQAGYTVSVLLSQDPHYVPQDSAFVQTLLQAYTDVTGQDGRALATGGGTYAKALSCGVAFGPVFPGEPDLAHCADESIRIDRVCQMTKIYVQALYRLGVANAGSAEGGKD
ncbi:MAG: dipeptidase PepV [Peptococcaceae bacterium]|jgi:succinyl-diaminopimelate desuccinylase|nr:dipeptidase PepV [Peptococcaceae bacterium]